MVINYKTENPAADCRREHAATIYVQLEELQQTFEGSFLPYLRMRSFSGPHLQKFLLSPSFMMSGFGV
jgi:hypothetical protein